MVELSASRVEGETSVLAEGDNSNSADEAEVIPSNEIVELNALENGLEFQIALDSLATGNLEPLKHHLAKLEGLDPNQVTLVSSEFKEFHPDSQLSFIGELDQIGEPGSEMPSTTKLGPRVVLDVPEAVYEYHPLRAEDKEIRLLRLGAKDEDGAHHGMEIETFKLEAAPSFYALSYVWGNPEKIMPLPCNGRRIMITQNLFRAINKIFERFPDVWVWADGICINQDDVAERGSQVGMMGEIYSKAALVVAHTGHHQYEVVKKSEGEVSEQKSISERIGNMQLVNKPIDSEVRQNIPAVPGEKDNAAQPAISLMNYLSRLWSFEDDYSITKSTDWSKHPLPETFEIWQRLFNFWSEDWFYRSWVLQEAVLGKKVILIVDDAACSLDFVMQFWERAKKRDTPEILRHGPLADEYTRILHLSPVTAMQVLRDFKHPKEIIAASEEEEAEKKEETKDETKHKSKSPFLDLLALSRINLASDPRDKIYSVLSLASADASARSIIPNYSSVNTATVLYQEIAKKLIDAGFGPELLQYSGIDHKIPDLPSWAPDWSHHSRSTLPSHLYNFSGSSVPKFNFSTSHPQKLNVRGVALDTIRWNAMAWRYYDISHSPEKGKFAPFKESPGTVFPPFSDEDCRCVIRDVAKRGQADYATMHNNEDPSIALARTLACDTTWRGSRTSADPTFMSSWEAFESLYSLGPDESTPENARIHQSGIFGWVRDHVTPQEEEKLKRKAWPFEVAMQNAHKGRRFCVSKMNGWMCTAPYDAERGDVLVLIEGCRTPFLIREEGEGEDWRVVGDVYVHGIMDGEVVVKVGEGEVGEDEVSIDAHGETYAVRIEEGVYGKFREFSIC